MSGTESGSPIQTVSLSGQTSNGTLSIPAGYQIISVVIRNTTGNAITGGLRIGTTGGAVDVVVALAVAGSALQAVADATLLKRVFSASVAQILFLEAVTLWNGASLNTTVTIAPFV